MRLPKARENRFCASPCLSPHEIGAAEDQCGPQLAGHRADGSAGLVAQSEAEQRHEGCGIDGLLPLGKWQMPGSERGGEIDPQQAGVRAEPRRLGVAIAVRGGAAVERLAAQSARRAETLLRI